MARTNPRSVGRARRLRREETPAEARLWGYLRDRRLKGMKFLRQAPVGSYIVDFLCREARLVVEVDGATHSTEAEMAYDHRRTAFIEGQGLRVVRLNNGYVFESLPEALETIVRAAEQVNERSP